MTINWFPGHMNKARRELAKALRRIDVVLEILDARLPQSSRNPMLAELRGHKPCLALLNKADLADPEITPAWLRVLGREADTLCLETSASQAATVRGVAAACRKLASHRQGPGKTLRCMVVGIPNVGKSTLINTLVGRKIARVGDQPAVTKTQHSYHLDEGISLSDTPGVLWPKLADQQGAYRLAASGAIRDTAFRYMDVALFAARFLRERYPEALAARFKLEMIPEDDEALIEALGRRRGFLRRGGVVDLERAAEVLLRELRAGKIGRISFETPDDFERKEIATDAEAGSEAEGNAKGDVKSGAKDGAGAQ
jgi:ribosome biogenesis GTPase A